MKKEKTLSILIYIFRPVILYLIVSELAAAVLDFVWDNYLQETALQGAGIAYSHSVQTVRPFLRLVLSAAAGCLLVRRDAWTELSAFSAARQKRRLSAAGAGKEKAPRDPAKTSFRSRLYAASDERVRMRVLSLLLPSVMSLALGINVLFSCFWPDLVSQGIREGLPGLAGMLLQIIIYCFFMPFVEETVFRGILFPRLQRQYGTGMAVPASALFFGLYHGTFSQGCYAFLMGIVFALAYESSGKFTVPLALHGACNLMILWLQWTDRYSAVCTPVWAAVFLGISAGGFFTIAMIVKKQ